MTQVTIIVVNYNQAEDTKDCLLSLSQVDRRNIKLKVLVVDNASTKPFKLPRQLSSSIFHLITSQSNLGFTGGNNLAIHYAVENFSSDYILLLNNDTLVDRKFLQHMLDHASAHPNHGIVSAKIYFAQGKEFHIKSYDRSDLGNVLWYAGGSIDWQNLVGFHRGVDEIDRGQFDLQVKSDFATGCALLIRREVLEKVGTLDKRYFLYFEDTDYSLRVKKAGLEVGFCAQAKVWHKNAGSSGGAGSRTAQYYQTRNRYLLTWLHGSWQAKFASLRLIWTDLLSNNDLRRKAVFDLVLGRLGKQPLV